MFYPNTVIKASCPIYQSFKLFFSTASKHRTIESKSTREKARVSLC